MRQPSCSTDGAPAAEGGQSGAHVLEVGGVASRRLHDKGGWGGEAQSGAGEEGGAIAIVVKTLEPTAVRD
jgi:hypothetical protein